MFTALLTSAHLFIALVNPIVLSLKIHHKFDHFLPHVNPVSFLATAKASSQVCPLLIWPLPACYPEAIQVILSQSCPIVSLHCSNLPQ